MQRSLLFKILAIMGVSLLIGVALALIQATVNERMDFRKQAVASIAHDSVGEQTVVGPVLVIRYSEDYEEQAPSANDKSKVETFKRSEEHSHVVFPNQLNIAGRIDTDRRYRGIHQVLVFGGTHEFSGDFLVPALAALPKRRHDSRLAVSFHRLVMPDGRTHSLDRFKGLGQIGDTGLKDRVDRHYLQVFGASLAIGAVSGLSQFGARSNVNAYDFGDAYRQGTGSALAASTGRVLDRYLNVLPTLTIREGYRIKVYLTNDLQLPVYATTSSGGAR